MNNNFAEKSDLLEEKIGLASPSPKRLVQVNKKKKIST